MNHQPSRKQFFAKLFGAAAAMVALPKLFAKSAASVIAPSAPAKTAKAEAMPVAVKVETRAVARRDDTL